MVVKAICGVSLVIGLLTGSIGGFMICWLGGYSVAQSVAIHLTCKDFGSGSSGSTHPMTLLSVALEEGLFK